MSQLHTDVRATIAALCLFAIPLPTLAQLPGAPPAPTPDQAAATTSTSLPAQIRSAKSIFLANAGAQTGFPYDSSVAYDQFVNDLQAWGHFTLAATPSDADLIFELRSANPVGGVIVSQGSGGSYRLPQLQLTIIDPRTQTHLWVISEPVYSTLNRKDKTDWFTVAVANLTTKVKELAGQPVSAAESAQLQQTPKSGHHPWVYAIVAAPIVLGVGGFLIAHHEYENGLAEQQAAQDAFCNAHNIPLSECAGG